MTDSLQKAKELAAKARDLILEIADTKARLADLEAQLFNVKNVRLPDLLQEIGMHHIGLDPEGNVPAYDVKIKPYFRASISSEWDEEKRKKAFKALVDHGAETLIKSEVVFSFPRGHHDKAVAFAKANAHLNPTIKESVHHTSLTAWVKENVEKGSPLPPLDTIGAQVGSVAELKQK